ncbi:hypothetical protein HYV79_05075 [Candidatus Woesearchaeota archaeon]|nr:hypothetical protein [Candidatus Woesearchaeota archaeon]
MMNELRKIILNHIVLGYLEDARTLKFTCTNKIVDYLLDKDSISFSDKNKNILKIIEDLEVLSEKVLFGETLNISRKQVKCAKEHIINLSPLAESLETEIEYWRVVDDLKYVQIVLHNHLEEDKRPRQFYDSLLIYYLRLNGIKAKVEYNIFEDEDPYGLFSN